MRYRLVVLTGSLAGRVREVDEAEIVLGRDPEAAQIVFDPEERRVSRQHASLKEENGRLVLKDLGSSTGTFVDGKDVDEVELAHGDVFELGRDGPTIRLDLGGGGTLEVDPSSIPAPTRVEEPAAEPAAEPADEPEDEAPEIPVLLPGSRLRLTVLSGSRKGAILDLAGALVRVGRAPGNTVSTPADPMVSAQHAKLVRLENTYVLMDLESTNGTFLNDRRVERARVREGDVIGLGPGGPQLQVAFLAPEHRHESPATVVIPAFGELAGKSQGRLLVEEVPLDRKFLLIGREATADVQLDSPIVSRNHARLVYQDEKLMLADLGSTNGTYLGGRSIGSAPLSDGDRFVVGPFELEVAAKRLRVRDTRHRVRLDARDLAVTLGGRQILEGISASLPPGSFTALIGPSGAGKSTLLTALSGARPADRGQVLLNGSDLYERFESLKADMGYVPQDDIVHAQLGVRRSLDYTAQLRLAGDTPTEQRARLVDDVLATLELTERADTPIHRLSGGQRKRVSIASELLTEPSLLFLDEPTSGLDPGLEEALMLLLRELAYKGKTVVVVTHTLDHIHLCDAVLLLVDGRLAFSGPAHAARSYFGVDHVVDLYSRLKEQGATDWESRFRETEGQKKLIEEPPPAAAASAAQAEPEGPPRIAPLRQLGVLARRYLETLTRDTRNATLLVAQAPLIAVLIGLSLLYGESDIGYTKPKNTILFLLALTSVWFGCSNAVRELVKERAIYLRERMVGLGVWPYILSKLVVLGGLALVQCVLFWLILDSWLGIPGQPALLLGAMLLISLVGIGLGLAISAFVSTPDRAMTLLPILLIPQVLFTIPSVQMDMKGPAGQIARAMPTWWGFDLMRRVALAPGQALDDEATQRQLEEGGPVLMTRDRFQSMLQEGYMMFRYRGAIEVTWTASLPDDLGERLPGVLGSWRGAVVDVTALLGFGLLLLGMTAALQKRFDRRRGAG